MKDKHQAGVLSALCILVVLSSSAPGLEAEKLAAQRSPDGASPRLGEGGREVFEFAEKPTVTREGDKVTIAFASKDACDATIAIEGADGKILRHLASGVLGPNAPAPFQKGTLKQAVVWDGKNDKEEYVDNKDQLIIRVSLGLKPQFERTLYWSPYKLGSGRELLSMCSAPEGVYVFSIGWGRQSMTPSLKLFDHDGCYVHTLYPFPAADLENVQGFTWQAIPPDGRKFPRKERPLSQTSLLSDRDYQTYYGADDMIGLAADHDYVYLAFGPRMNRIAKPGSGKPSILQSPNLTMFFDLKGKPLTDAEANEMPADEVARYQPHKVAVSPDGKWLYLTSYAWFAKKKEASQMLPCVTRMPADCSRPPELFAGGTEAYLAADDIKPRQSPAGSVLAKPMDVACDREGRVYVADNARGLVIFTPAGKVLHQVSLKNPARVSVALETGDTWVAGWVQSLSYGTALAGDKGVPGISLSRLTPCRADRPPEVAQSLILEKDPRSFTHYGMNVQMDLHAKTTRLWYCPGPNVMGIGPAWQHMNARVLEIQDSKLGQILSFEAQTKREVVQTRPPRYGRQRPYANPADGCVYIAEQIQPTVIADVQDFDQLVKIAPDTGKITLVSIPFDAEDMAFDIDGMAYLRTPRDIVRYDPQTWREVSFDYGEEQPSVTSRGLKGTKTTSSLFFAGGEGASSKIMGMSVNAKGDVACSFYSTSVSSVEVAGESLIARPDFDMQKKGVKEWKPRIYPGRSTHTFIHVWDKHGKLKFEDAVKGLGEISDLKLDAADNLYMIANMNLLSYAKDYPDKAINTLLKVPADKGRFLTAGHAPTPLANGAKPNRPPDADGISGYNGKVWLDGAEWAVGGIGANSRGLASTACHCEGNTGLALDLYGRSFAPVIHRFEVVVVDTAGNTVVRIGRCGNVEDGVPLVKDGGPANPRSLGGDEVSIMSAKWLGVLSDRRLFVADRGNYRVLCIKLGYHAEAKVAMKNVSDSMKGERHE